MAGFARGLPRWHRFFSPAANKTPMSRRKTARDLARERDQVTNK